LRIGVDAREIQGQMTGIGRYLTGFLKHASAGSHEYFLYYQQAPESNLNYPKIKSRVLNGQKFIWDHILLPKALARDRVDLFFSPYYKRPWFLKCRSVVTVHDLNILSKRDYPFWHRLYFRALISRSIKKADIVMTVSNYVKEDIVKTFKLQANKIIVNYNSIDQRFRPEASGDAEAVLAKYDIDSKYVLYVGNLMPHKNISSLIKAYSQLPVGLKDKYKLVIAGGKNWTYKQLFELSGKLGLLNHIVFTGFIADEDLACVYREASLFVFPSFMEGFGFPPLEAMACGVPVVAAKGTSLPEVLGDAAILVEAVDLEGLRKAINEVLTNEKLKMRLIDKGLNRIKLFSLNKMAETILVNLERCAA
jgi:glycosyltransferase involved in cell wall biosynthesis